MVTQVPRGRGVPAREQELEEAGDGGLADGDRPGVPMTKGVSERRIRRMRRSAEIRRRPSM